MKEAFVNNKDFYKPYTDIIKARWDKHLKRNLHAAAYFLNPACFFEDKLTLKVMNKIVQSMLDLFEMEDFNIDLTKALQEMQVYRDRQGSFSRESALRVAKTIRPDNWWISYGSSAPILQQIAIRLLSQTSSSGCERNWSVFESIHTRKRNRLTHQRLDDLVFVTYNLRLKNRFHYKKTCYDPIEIESIDDVDFWVTEEEVPPELNIGEFDHLFFSENATTLGEPSRNNEGDQVSDWTNIGGGSTNEDAIPNAYAHER